MKIETKSLHLILILLLFFCFFPLDLFGQQPDSVEVTFFYRPQGNPSVVYLPGEFNNWGNNIHGRIFDTRFAMRKDAVTGIWFKTVRLRLGGPSPLPASTSIPGAYQYKFNENGQVTGWKSDPLNPRMNFLDNNNSYLFIKDPTIHYLLPNSVSKPVPTDIPEITAYIFPALSSTVLADSIKVFIDGKLYTNVGTGYDTTSRKFSFIPPTALDFGTHTLKLAAQSSKGTTSIDSTTFELVEPPGIVSFLTRPNPRQLRPTKNIAGLVEDNSINSAVIIHNGDSSIVAVTNGKFQATFNLAEKENLFSVQVVYSLGVTYTDGPLIINYFVEHAPKPQIFITRSGNNELKLTFASNDPDNDPVSALWTSDDAINPQPLNIHATAESVTLPLPATPGEYFIDLQLSDPDSNIGVARNYFIVKPGNEVRFASINSNPAWVNDAIVYEIFVPAFTPQGTFAAAQERLPLIKALGATVIWLMPIYENGTSINELNAGYNITDFFSVHSQLGTFESFQAFLQEAHDLGIRVILDSTPNHVSGNHEWVKDVEEYRDFSNYRPLLENQILGNDRGLGQFRTSINNYVVYVHYSNWTLANLDYQNIETRDFMLNMYKFWILDQGVDGYRMDVYWGPQNRYGKTTWWRLFREEMKRVRPDIFILGETDGTGAGSENNYADFGGANDAAYDWNFYGEIRNTLNGGSLKSLDNRVRNFSPNLNYNHFTGINSHYLRFLENHDETRIAQLVGLSRSKAGAALLFTIPGIPLIYAGQEVGETNRRGQINWQRARADETLAFYQRLGAIRNTFSTFRSRQIKRLASGHARVYAYLRPQLDENAIAAVNFSGNAATATLSIQEADLQLSADSLFSGKVYYLNDVLNDTAYSVSKSSINNFTLDLPPWGATVLVLADSVIELVTSVKAPVSESVPEQFELFQNYPNPFNPVTTIQFELPERSRVNLSIYNILGRKVRTLLNTLQPAGSFRVQWDGQDEQGMDLSSGVYILRLQAGTMVKSVKLLKLK